MTDRPACILGTAAYMSPEQARGKDIDKRTDIWAFGAVLYEMLTGRRAFAGEEMSDALASVLAREPDWTLLPPGLSPVLVACIKRCLQKDRKQRIRDIGDVLLVLAARSIRQQRLTWRMPLRSRGRCGDGRFRSQRLQSSSF